MNFRNMFFPILTAAALTLGSLPVNAAMPVVGQPVIEADHILQIAKKRKSSRQKEIDRSVDNKTVPSRYRRNVPREYQQYIPFEQGRGRP